MEGYCEVAENIFQIEALESKSVSPAIEVYFIRGKYPALIDTGPSAAIPSILKVLQDLGQDPFSLTYIFLTHVHMDHGGGAGYLTRQLPQAKVIVHPAGAPHLSDPSRLIAGAAQLFGEEFPQEFGLIQAVPEDRIRVAQDGEVFALGEKELEVIYSPGHASHHMSFYDRKSKGLFCGEALGSSWPKHHMVLPMVSPPRFDVEVYLKTVSRLKGLAPTALFFAHGGTQRETDQQFQLLYDSLRKCFSVIATRKTLEEQMIQLRDYFPREIVKEFDFLFRIVLTQGTNYFKEARVSPRRWIQLIDRDRGG